MEMFDSSWGTGLSDPYCIVSVPNGLQEEQLTGVQSETLDPVWNERFTMSVFLLRILIGCGTGMRNRIRCAGRDLFSPDERIVFCFAGPFRTRPRTTSSWKSCKRSKTNFEL